MFVQYAVHHSSYILCHMLLVTFKILTGRPAGKRPLGRTILEWTLKRWVSMRVIGLILLGIGIIGEPCKCGIEPTGSISHGVS